MSETGVIRGREKRRQRRHHGNRGKTKVALAVLRLFQLLHHTGRGAHGAPAHSVFAGDYESGVQRFGVGEDFRKHICLRIAVARVQHRRPDGGCEFLSHSHSVVLLKKGHGLCRCEPLGIFRKRLRRNAYSLHLISARFKSSLRAAQHFQSVGDLLLILVAIQIDECRNRANLRLHIRWRGCLGLRPGAC